MTAKKLKESFFSATTIFMTIILFLFAGSYGYTFTKSDKSRVERLAEEVREKSFEKDLQETKDKIETIRCENNSKIEKIVDTQADLKQDLKQIEINILRELRAMNK